MVLEPIELVVGERHDTLLELDGGGTVTFGADEYIPMAATDLPEYGGPYEVVPRLVGQTLATALMRMREDVTVEGIPSYRTTNPSGGYTVVIAQD